MAAAFRRPLFSMPRESAGILMWRRTAKDDIEVLLAHPGGPYWKNRDQGAWSIPKGEIESDDPDALTAARREFFEETGHRPGGAALDLGHVRQAGGKQVHAFAIEGSMDPESIQPHSFDLEWPPKSGRVEQFPEIDRVAWFGLDEARTRINPAQTGFLDRLAEHLQTGRNN